MDNISKSEIKTPLLGDDYVQHYDSEGFKSGRSVQEGDHIQHYDNYGRKTGTSKVNAQGETEHFDKYGRKTGTSKEDVFGTIRHYDNRGRHTGTTTKNFWGNEQTHVSHPVGSYTVETESGTKIHYFDSILHPVYIEGGVGPRNYTNEPEYSRFSDRLSAGVAYVFGITLILALLMLFIPGQFLMTVAHAVAQWSVVVFGLLGAVLSLWPFFSRTKLSKKKDSPSLRKSGGGFLVVHLVLTMALAVILLPRLYGYLMMSLSSDDPISHIFRALPIWVVLVVYGLFLGIGTNSALKKYSEYRSEIVTLSQLCNGCFSLLLSIPFSFMLYLQDVQSSFGSRLLSTVVACVILLLGYKVLTVVGNFLYALIVRLKH